MQKAESDDTAKTSESFLKKKYENRTDIIYQAW